MPRTGGIYNAPAGTKGVPNTTIQSAPYNALIDDLVQDANAARPITAGGTGATDATTARNNLGAMATADLAAAATKAVPVDNDTFLVLDSEDTNKLKRFSWSVIKTKLREFFDPLYYIPGMNTIELGANQATDTVAAIDLHATPASDYNARIMRIAGANGELQIIQTGTGDIRFTGGNVRIAELLLAAKSISTQGSITVDNDSFSFLSLRNAAGTEKAALYAQSVGGNAFLRVAGTVSFTFGADGKFTAPSSLGAGSAALNSDGNVSGSVWAGWNATYTDAFNAINARIEARASAYAGLAQTNAIAQIMPTVAAQNVGDVGTYAMLKAVSGSAPVPGTLKSGSELQYTNSHGDGYGSLGPSGTWMCCGVSIVTSAISDGAVTIYLKKAA
ncbi:hypothetical protein ACTJJ7_19995 [Phyllobacterium sp. 22229]|uniref:hypothetical protein n=1 Tax=Phyllobacterium sp. 22229 TaxID=3453895 RepID=UPI003F876E08